MVFILFKFIRVSITQCGKYKIILKKNAIQYQNIE
jgi:hypothetical protein